MAKSKGLPGDLGVFPDPPTEKDAKAPDPRPKAAAPGEGVMLPPPPGVVAEFVDFPKDEPSLPDRFEKGVVRVLLSPPPFEELFCVESESLLLLYNGKVWN